MGWFSCLMIRKKALKIEDTDRAQSAAVTAEVGSGNASGDGAGSSGVARVTDVAARAKSPAKSFTYRELCIATGMFNSVNLIGEGGFGKVFKGRLDTGEVVAIKQLNHQGAQGSQEFIVEVLMLSLLHHPNLMTLKGYCTDGDEKLLVYEYMPKGSLEDLLFDLTPEKVPLDWDTRIKIAINTARGLEYLHMSANPPVIYRDLKSANVLLDNDFNAKLSDFGLAKLGPVGDKTHVSTRVMGTYGYCAPEYAMSGKLTMKSDIYSLGVVLLELVSGRKSIDPSRCRAEQNLVNWAKPLLKDRSRMHTLADPALQDQYPLRPFQHLVAIAGMCLQDVPAFRPLITDVIVALEYVIQECEASSSSGTRRSYHQPTPSRGDRSRY